jgi:hypothetical protein
MVIRTRRELNWRPPREGPMGALAYTGATRAERRAGGSVGGPKSKRDVNMPTKLFEYWAQGVFTWAISISGECTSGLSHS